MQSLPDSTHKMLAFKALNRDFDITWTDWAVEMLMNGHDTEHLVILAGMSEPFDYFEMQALTTKVFNELDLDFSDKLQVILNYVRYLIREADINHTKPMEVLREVKDLYLELGHEKSLQYFYFLYYAKIDLMEDEIQWYIDGVDRINIDEAIDNFFTEWLNISKT